MRDTLIVLIDIGNTNITVGIRGPGTSYETLRVRTDEDPHVTEECINRINGFVQSCKPAEPEGACICSVIPDLTLKIKEYLAVAFKIKPLVVDHTLKTGLTFSIDNLSSLGTDRIVNAAAAHRLYRGDLIIVDAGTATTFCVVTAAGDFKGGAIMPGLGLSVDALYRNTAQLPNGELTLPPGVIGKNTENSIRTGVILGHAGAIERIIKEICHELNRNCTVVLTGGYSGLLKQYVSADYVNPDLTLDGLNIIYELNSSP